MNNNEQNLGALVESVGDNIYYNVSIPHDDLSLVDNTGLQISASPTLAKFLEIRQSPLFYDSPKNYTLSVVRFQIPTSTIPIFIAIPNLFQTAMPPNINELSYSVTLQWMGFNRQVNLLWTTEDLTAPIPPGLINDYVSTEFWQYYAVYSYQHFVDIINIALNTAYLQILADGAPVTSPPFFSYDSTNNLFTLYANSSYLSGSPGSVNIFMDNVLYSRFLNSFNNVKITYDAFGINGKNVQFIIDDLVTNRVVLPAPFGNVFAIVQEYNGLAKMLAFTSLILTTNTLPIRSEWISLQKKLNVFLGKPVSLPIISGNFYRILSNFEVNLEDGLGTRNFVNFIPSSEFRRITLESDIPITTIDLQIFWKDNYDNLFPLYIPLHTIASIKLLFEKR